MSLRVALLAEGSGDRDPPRTQRVVTALPTPGMVLREDDLGPAHFLLRRAITRATSTPEAGVHFVEPLRTASGAGRRLTGSDLLNLKRLRKALTWPPRHTVPDLQIVLVDQDDDSRDRYKWIRDGLSHTTAKVVIAVAVREFETWLVADDGWLRNLGGHALGLPLRLEKLPPRECKEALAGWCADHQNDADPKVIRMDLARNLNLTHLAKRCPAFDRLLRDLESAHPNR